MWICRRSKRVGAHLPEDTLRELERRGPAVVRDQMAKVPGYGSGATFPMQCGLKQDPLRAAVEVWLAEHQIAAEELATCRHRQVLFWAVAATVVGAIGIAISALQ
jgi:hypothetical protein